MDQKGLIKFLILWVINTLLLLIFSVIFASDVVLGNASITKAMASVVNGLILTILVFLVPQTAAKLDLKLKDEKALVSAYFVVDLIALWILKRLADITGLGISNILFVLIVAVCASLVQLGVNKYSPKLVK